LCRQHWHAHGAEPEEKMEENLRAREKDIPTFMESLQDKNDE
jgi:hypothetical protein